MGGVQPAFPCPSHPWRCAHRSQVLMCGLLSTPISTKGAIAAARTAATVNKADSLLAVPPSSVRRYDNPDGGPCFSVSLGPSHRKADPEKCTDNLPGPRHGSALTSQQGGGRRGKVMRAHSRMPYPAAHRPMRSFPDTRIGLTLVGHPSPDAPSWDGSALLPRHPGSRARHGPRSTQRMGHV